MLSKSINSNITISIIENFLNKFDIKMTETHKAILSALIPGLIFRDGKIIIMSITINQINKILKKKNENLNFVSILLGFDIITHIDKYGTITIPLALLLSKMSINKETISINGEDVLRKKLLNNATQTLVISELLSHLNIPKELSIIFVSSLLDLADSDINNEFKIMSSNSIGFKDCKFSDTKKILKRMEFDRIILNIMILLVINYVGFNIGRSLILVHILTTLLEQINSYTKKKKCKGFLN